MNIFSGLEKVVKENYPVSGETWYGIGGQADYFIRPENKEQLKKVVERCNEKEIPVHVLGFGSNLLISDEGVRGAVVKLDSEYFNRSNFEGVRLTAGAGANLNELVFESVRKGLSGLEALTGIPGSVGGAIKMNAGGSFGDIGAVVKSVTLMGGDGKVFEKSKPELTFNYRETNITAKYILGAELELSETDSERALKEVKEVWIYKKNTQPLEGTNSGCVFKNPRGVSAGALIDRAGLKGLQIEGAKVSEKHGNFIIAEKGCRSGDVLRLIEAVRERVKEEFDVELELELEIWE